MHIDLALPIGVGSDAPSTYHTISTTTGQDGVILGPRDASYTARMTLEDEIGWVVDGVEAIHVDELIGVGAVDCCEVLSTIAEFDFFAGPEGHNLPVVLDLVVVHADVHQSEAITETHDDVEAGGVERHAISLLIEGFVGLNGPLLVVPDADELVHAARDDEGLTYAYVHAIDGAGVVW